VPLERLATVIFGHLPKALFPGWRILKPETGKTKRRPYTPPPLLL
jgi:hypothetical protein